MTEPVEPVPVAAPAKANSAGAVPCWTPRRVGWYAFLAAVLLALAAMYGYRLNKDREQREADYQNKSSLVIPTNDFGVFHRAAQRLVAGEPLYRGGVQPAAAGARQNRGDGTMGFKYGPLFALLLAPLAPLPGVWAAGLWSFGNLLAIVGLGWILGRWMRRYVVLQPAQGERPARMAPAAWGWIALAGSIFFLQLNMAYGQTNLVFMFLLLAGLELYAEGRPVSGGLLAGLVAGMRLTPLVFLPYFLWKRQWRAAGGMGLGLALSFAIPLLWWGPAEFGRQMQEWRELVAADEVLDTDTLRLEADAASAAQPPLPAAANADDEDAFYLRPSRYQSIPPMVLDTFAQDYTPRRPEDKTHPLQGQRNFLKGMLGRRAATLVAYGLAALFCLACAVLCWRNYPARDLRHPLEWALVLTAMLLVSPYTERTHFAALAPGLGLVIAGALAGLQRADLTTGARARGYAVGAAALVLFFNVFNHSFLPGDAAEWFKGFHGYVVGAIGLFVVLAVWLVRRHRAAAVTAG